LLTQVQFVKETRGKRFISVDTGMHHLIRPALYGAYHEIVPFQATPGPWTPADVVGPICESADFLAQGRAMPTVKRGDLLAVMTTGAYGYSLASNYNSQLLPAEVLVKGQQFNVIRHRQKYPDLLRLMA
jgi:diaminopimelate decarboxylase